MPTKVAIGSQAILQKQMLSRYSKRNKPQGNSLTMRTALQEMFKGGLIPKCEKSAYIMILQENKSPARRVKTPKDQALSIR